MVVTPGDVRRKGSAVSSHHLNPTKLVAVAPAANSVSGQMDAMQLRDELLQLRKEMNAIKKEKDIAKAQQVVWECVHGCGVLYYVC